MKTHLDSYKKYSKKTSIILIILTILVLSTSCSKKLNSNKIVCNEEDYSLYPEFLKSALPGYSIDQAENRPYYILNEGGISEAFDTQAVGAIEAGIGKYWYPHYLATVIIAIDRDQTNTILTGWNDLFYAKEDIGFFNMPGNIQMLTSAMSYGLEGENYSTTKTIEILSSLEEEERLKINSFQAPFIICYDYQAANLMKNGRNIEIIVPIEGTYTYEKGLLSKEKLYFQEDLDKLLLASNLRLLDGKSNPSLYPNHTSYGPAVRVLDYKHLAKATRNITCLMERKVLNSRKYMSIDNREHLHFALVYTIIITFWVASVLHRSMQKSISYAAFFTGIILNGWILVRLIKYQVEAIPTLNRYLWYSFYIFQLSLPLVILWMAWAIDKPKDEIFPPKWWRKLVILIALLIILVFTNDLHGFVFKLDLSRSDWGINYSYGFGYYIILFVCMGNLLASFAILLKKSIKSPRKKVFIVPLGIFFLFGYYNYKYIMRDSFVYKTDLTIVTGIFVLLMFEACIRAGLIPVNTKYIDIFRRSPLKIQILNNKKEVVISSALARPIDKSIIEKVISSSPEQLLQEDGSLLFADSIPGGYSIWSEDVTKLQQLNREIKRSTEKLIEANVILGEEEKIKRSINEKKAKKQLMEQLEGEIAENIEKLSRMIEELEHSEEHSMESTRIGLLLCYIKRKCNLFFKEKKMETGEVEELIMYIEELADIAKIFNVEIVISNSIEGYLSIRYTSLFYDFFYNMVDLGIKRSCSYMIVDIGWEEDFITMGILPSIDIGSCENNLKMEKAIEKENGKILRKNIEDTVATSIYFPKGGEKND